MKPVYKTPYEFLREIEAYLTFRLLTDKPTIPSDDMQRIKDDIYKYLEEQGEL